MRVMHRTPTPPPPEGDRQHTPLFECLVDPLQPLPARKAAARATEKLKELTSKLVKGESSEFTPKGQGAVCTLNGQLSGSDSKGKQKDEGSESGGEGEQKKVNLTALRLELGENGVMKCPYEVRRRSGGGSGGED